MEIYAIYTGKLAHYNNKFDVGNDYATLQVLFNKDLEEFDSDDLEKFVLYQTKVSDIDSIVPYKKLKITHVDAATQKQVILVIYSNKIILKNNAKGQIIKNKSGKNGKSEFDKAMGCSPERLSKTDFQSFLTTNNLQFADVNCSTSRFPCED
jgi:plasmid maintenance system killer protein